MSAKTCGVAEHIDDCLCDVIIKSSTPIGVFDGVHGMWMGAEVCRVRGYSAPWTSEKLADYLQDLSTFYDRWSELQANPASHQNPAHERMVQLLKQGHENRVVGDMVYAEFGVRYHRSAISHTKKRIGLSTTKPKA